MRLADGEKVEGSMVEVQDKPRKAKARLAVQAMKKERRLWDA